MCIYQKETSLNFTVWKFFHTVFCKPIPFFSELGPKFTDSLPAGDMILTKIF